MQAAKKILLSTAIALTGVTAIGITAEARTVIYADIAPPALRVETVPAPREGYVWVPGYWGWEHKNYVWVGGRWEHERHGYHWRSPRWEHEGNRWRYHDGGWEH